MARRERVASTRRAFTARGTALGTAQPLALPVGVPGVRGPSPPGAPPPDLPPPLESLFDTAPESWLALQGVAVADLERLAQLAIGFSPRVSLEPDAVLLEVRGSFRLFGGARALCAQVLARCREAGLAPRWSLAPTPLAALALSRAGRSVAVLARDRLVGALVPLPIAVLGWPPAALARLESIGVRTLGAAQRLPRAGFARRFGPAAMADLDRLTGLCPEPRRAHVPRERFRTRCDPAFEADTAAVVLREAEPLLVEFEEFLRSRQCGVDLLMLRLSHRARDAQHGRAAIPPHTQLDLRLAASEHRAAAFAALLTEHLARTVLPAPVIRLELRSGRLRPVVAGSAALWRPGEHGGGLARESPALIERLRARLGHDAVYGLCLVPQHRPESAWRVAEPALPSASRVTATPAHPGSVRRPLWLLREPAPLPWPFTALQRLEGPERLETGWWDGLDIARDYYIACEPSGAEVWVYRERLAPHAWWLHGVFG